MQKTLLGLAVLMMVGAGCGTDSIPPQTKSAGEPTIPATTQTTTTDNIISDDPVTETTDFAITAEALGNQIVRVAFELPAEMKKGADMYRLLISTNEKPTRENATNWYDLNTAHQTKDWNVSLIGHRYVRVCVVREAKCTEYSNIVPVNVR